MLVLVLNSWLGLIVECRSYFALLNDDGVWLHLHKHCSRIHCVIHGRVCGCSWCVQQRTCTLFPQWCSNCANDTHVSAAKRRHTPLTQSIHTSVLTHSRHSLTLSLTHSLTHTHLLTHLLIHSLAHSRMHSLMHSLPPLLTLTSAAIRSQQSEPSHPIMSYKAWLRSPDDFLSLHQPAASTATDQLLVPTLHLQVQCTQQSGCKLQTHPDCCSTVPVTVHRQSFLIRCSWTCYVAATYHSKSP